MFPVGYPGLYRNNIITIIIICISIVSRGVPPGKVLWCKRQSLRGVSRGWQLSGLRASWRRKIWAPEALTHRHVLLEEGRDHWLWWPGFGIRKDGCKDLVVRGSAFHTSFNQLWAPHKEVCLFFLEIWGRIRPQFKWTYHGVSTWAGGCIAVWGWQPFSAKALGVSTLVL